MTARVIVRILEGRTLNCCGAPRGDMFAREMSASARESGVFYNKCTQP